MDRLDKQIKLPFSTQPVSLRYLLVHSLYWILITGFFLYEKKYLIYKASLPYFFICVVYRIALLMLIAYLNLNYFLPGYLLKRRYVRYFTAVLLSIAGYLLAQSLFDYYLYGYVIGPVLNSTWMETFSYNFFSTIWYLAFMLALKLSMDWYEQQRMVHKIAMEKLQAEVNYLRSQMNPHFLFNALNNLYALTLKKSDMAPDIVLKLSGLMEYMLYESNETYVPLAKEIKYLNNYLELEKIRQGSRADVRLTVKGSTDHCRIPPFLILPLAENAFKHGINKVAHQQAYLHICICIDDKLEISVENSRVNFRQGDQGSGIGLLNLRKRLELLYPGKHELQIADLPDRYKVELKIDLPC